MNFYLLKIEWKKILHNTTLKALLAAYFFFLPLMFLSGKNIQMPNEFGSIDMFYMFPNVWKYLGYCGNWLVFFFLGLLVILLIGNDFSYKTLRQSVINGLTRKEVFVSKLMLLWSLSSIGTAYYVLNVLIFGTLHTDTIYMSKVLENIDFLPRYFVMCWGYMSFGLMLTLLFRKTGAAIIVYVIYIMILEPIIRWALQAKFRIGNAMNYFPMNAIEDLAPIPSPIQIPNEMKQQGFDIFLHPAHAVTVSLIFIAIFLSVGYYRVLKSDL